MASLYIPPKVVLPLYRILSTLAAQSKVIERGSLSIVVKTLTSTLRNQPQPALNTMTAFALLHQGQMSRIIDQILTVMLQFKSAIKLQLTILEFLSMLGRLPTYAARLKMTNFRQVRIVALSHSLQGSIPPPAILCAGNSSSSFVSLRSLSLSLNAFGDGHRAEPGRPHGAQKDWKRTQALQQPRSRPRRAKTRRRRRRSQRRGKRQTQSQRRRRSRPIRPTLPLWQPMSLPCGLCEYRYKSGPHLLRISWTSCTKYGRQSLPMRFHARLWCCYRSSTSIRIPRGSVPTRNSCPLVWKCSSVRTAWT